uniref:Myomesin 3 n=1 Tax=Junco hyemalis TaxID=40217 RepID=A0A8C5IBI3_JUNHY
AEGQTYQFRVRAVNKAGTSHPSRASDPVTTQDATPPSPPSQVLAFRDTRTSVVVQWDKPKDGPEPLGYYIYCRETGTEQWQTVNNKPVTGSEFTVPGLQPGKEYVFCVKSVSDAGLSESSPETDPIVVRPAIACPSAPRDFVLLHCGKAEMTIGWKAPKHKGGTKILGYFLDQHEPSEPDWHEVNARPIPRRVCTVSSLQEGHLYQFRARAMNRAGVGAVSEPSDLFRCEEWTMPEPGPPHDVRCTEVRDCSLQLHWEAPLYLGAGPLTGYFIELCEEGSEEWKQINKQPTGTTHMKVCTCPECPGAACPALTLIPGRVPCRCQTWKEASATFGVDEEGFIYMAFEAPEKNDSSEFIWSKDYEGPPDPDRVQIEEEGNRSKLILKEPSEKDLGVYSVEVTDVDDDISASCTLTKEEPVLCLGFPWCFSLPPVIKLISGWNVDVLEKGEVRLWLQVEKLSPNAELHLIFNDKELTSTPTHKINFVKEKGLVELIIQDFCADDKGMYTAQLKDGKAKNQFTLALIDESNCAGSVVCEGRGGRAQHQHHPPCSSGWDFVLNREIWEFLLNSSLYFTPPALSATPLKIQPTEEGIKIYTEVKYYTDYMKTTWYHKEKQLESRDRTRAGSTMNQLWLHILEPGEADRGKYTLEIFDGSSSHRLTLHNPFLFCELNFPAHLQLHNPFLFYALNFPAHLQLHNPFLFSVSPQTLCLTCCVSGDPYPEITWFKNEKVIEFKDRYKMDVKGSMVTITIERVCNEDTGKYSIYVKNKYGSETGQVTISVYKHGEIPIGTDDTNLPPQQPKLDINHSSSSAQ